MSASTRRAFSVGQVAPAGWGALPGERRSLAGTVAALPASAGLARWRCAEFAESVGASVSTVEAVMLCVSEAVANVVLHAYPSGRTGMARIVARLDSSGDLMIGVADDGVGIRPDESSEPPGNGLTVIHKLAKDVRVDSSPENGTSVEMTFSLAGPAPR